MNNNRDCTRIVIVDGYSTARDLLPELLERGVECLHVQSTREVPAAAAGSFDPAGYDGNLGYLGDVGTTTEVLCPLAPHAVIAGSEWGVTFAEQVAYGMGLPTNRIATIHARRDKFDMIEAVRRNGLRAAAQFCTSRADQAHVWADRHGRWPIIVKPPAGAGAEGVAICRGHADIDTAFTNALGRENSMCCRNDRMLLQSYLAGPQFIVNAVSWNGRHYITDVWSLAMVVRGTSVVPHEMHLLDAGDPSTERLMHYTLGVLEALGIENGASHSELKWTADGPVLIETGARLMGAAMDRPSYRFAGMESQAMVYARVLARMGGDCDALFARRHYAPPRRHITKLLFDFEAAGEVRGTEGLARLRELPSFHAHYRPLAKGARVARTADWLCRGGVVYLVHEDRAQIAADIEAIRRWERRGQLYDIAPADLHTDAVS